MKWYWFVAIKNGRECRERIPAKTWSEAKSELKKMGYSSIKMINEHPMYDYTNTYAYSD